MVNYIYDGAQVIEERDGNWALLRRYVYGPGIDEPISIYDAAGAKTCFYQRDGLGSVTEIVDDQGEVIERCRYSPYGKLKIYDSSWNELTASALGNPYFFTGREYDPESGLYYYRARMYSASSGRFMQTEPLSYWGDINLYRYCTNNPLLYLDPLGMQPTPEFDSFEKAICAASKILKDLTDNNKVEYKTNIEYLPDKNAYTYTKPVRGWETGVTATAYHENLKGVMHSHKVPDMPDGFEAIQAATCKVPFFIVTSEGKIWVIDPRFVSFGNQKNYLKEYTCPD